MSLKYLLFVRLSICFMSKISKEIWQRVIIWSENVFKENLFLQFWLEEFH